MLRVVCNDWSVVCCRLCCIVGRRLLLAVVLCLLGVVIFLSRAGCHCVLFGVLVSLFVVCCLMLCAACGLLPVVCRVF